MRRALRTEGGGAFIAARNTQKGNAAEQVAEENTDTAVARTLTDARSQKRENGARNFTRREGVRRAIIGSDSPCPAMPM